MARSELVRFNMKHLSIGKCFFYDLSEIAADNLYNLRRRYGAKASYFLNFR